MFKHFFSLQWKSFWRSASLSSSLWMKVFMAFMGLVFILYMLGGSFGLYFYIEKELKQDPLVVINKFLIYWIIFDLIFKYALQKMPVLNIKSLLILPIRKKKIVSYALGKTIFSFFNIIHAFFFIPFSVLLVVKGNHPMTNVLAWHLGVMFLIYDITIYTTPFFQGLYDISFMFLIPMVAVAVLVGIAFSYFSKILYLDAGLAVKAKNVKSENLDWLNRFGKTAIFLKNDIKLIKRNKRSKTTVFMSIMFLFYGLLFFPGIVEAYNSPVWRIFAAIFVTGGFLLTFGQFVPSWDSAYYPLLMTQNIRYKEYLSSKWWLMVIATLISTVLASGYLYYGVEVYIAILVAAIYNIGVNSHIVLWAGAYVRTPIDLTSNKKAFGDKQSFNIKTLMLALPKMALPMVLYAIGHYAYSPYAGYGLVAISGVIGFAFRGIVFNKIEKIYTTEKHKTLWAYKQKK